METITLNNYESFLLDYLEGNLSNESRAELELFVITHRELEIDLDDHQLPKLSKDSIEAVFKIHLKKTELNFSDEALLNYLDNNLSEAEIKVFENKLLTDRDLATEYDCYKKTLLVADRSFAFDKKSALVKSGDDLILNNNVLAYFENALSSGEKAEFESAIKNDLSIQKELVLVSKTKLSANFSLVCPNKAELKKESVIIVLFNIRTLSAMAAAILLLFGFVFVFNYYTVDATAEAGTRGTVLAKKEKSSLEPVLKKNTFSLVDVLNKEAANQRIAHKSKKDAKKKDAEQKQQTSIEDPQITKALIQDQMQLTKETFIENELSIANKEMLADQMKNEVVETDFVSSDAIAAKAVTLTVLEESFDDADDAQPVINGFWNKVVKLAERANRLGLKSIDGVEQPNKKFSLSFNAFSVEKH